MKLFVVIFSLLFGAVFSDPATLIDEILLETRKKIDDSLPFSPLNYYHRTYNYDEDHIEAELKGMRGHLLLGPFVREQAPVVWGSKDHGILESRFKIGSSIAYEKFSAANFTSGQSSVGTMTVSYPFTEIFSWISITRNGDRCETKVTSFTPIELSDPEANFVSSTSTDLPNLLFSDAKYTLNFYLNQTIINKGIKPFSDVVRSRSDLCSLL